MTLSFFEESLQTRGNHPPFFRESGRSLSITVLRVQDTGKAGRCSMGWEPVPAALSPENKLAAQTTLPFSTQQGHWKQPHLTARAEKHVGESGLRRGWVHVSFDSTVFLERSGAQLWFATRSTQTTGWLPGTLGLPMYRFGHIQNMRPRYWHP